LQTAIRIEMDCSLAYTDLYQIKHVLCQIKLALGSLQAIITLSCITVLMTNARASLSLNLNSLVEYLFTCTDNMGYTQNFYNIMPVF